MYMLLCPICVKTCSLQAGWQHVTFVLGRTGVEGLLADQFVLGGVACADAELNGSSSSLVLCMACMRSATLLASAVVGVPSHGAVL